MISCHYLLPDCSASLLSWQCPWSSWLYKNPFSSGSASEASRFAIPLCVCSTRELCVQQRATTRLIDESMTEQSLDHYWSEVLQCPPLQWHAEFMTNFVSQAILNDGKAWYHTHHGPGYRASRTLYFDSRQHYCEENGTQNLTSAFVWSASVASSTLCCVTPLPVKICSGRSCRSLLSQGRAILCRLQETSAANTFLLSWSASLEVSRVQMLSREAFAWGRWFRDPNRNIGQWLTKVVSAASDSASPAGVLDCAFSLYTQKWIDLAAQVSGMRGHMIVWIPPKIRQSQILWLFWGKQPDKDARNLFFNFWQLRCCCSSRPKQKVLVSPFFGRSSNGAEPGKTDVSLLLGRCVPLSLKQYILSL